MTDLIIENGRIIDGDGNPAFEASVLVQGGKINAVGTPARPIVFTSVQDDVTDPADLPFPTRGLWGGSAIIDPWGNVLASLDDQPGIAVAEIDLDLIGQHRSKMPTAQHRKLI